MQAESKLALFGGPKSVTMNEEDVFTWPIITREDEDAVQLLGRIVIFVFQRSSEFQEVYRGKLDLDKIGSLVEWIVVS